MALTIDSPTIRELVVAAMRTKLGEITIANGYHFEVGVESVFDLADAPTSQADLPSITLIQGVETVEFSAAQKRCTLEVIVAFQDDFAESSGNTTAGYTRQKKTQDFLGDIQRCLANGFGVLVPKQPDGATEETMIARCIEQQNSLNLTMPETGLHGDVLYNVFYQRSPTDPRLH